jgi:hypothetical protein
VLFCVAIWILVWCYYRHFYLQYAKMYDCTNSYSVQNCDTVKFMTESSPYFSHAYHTWTLVSVCNTCHFDTRISLMQYQGRMVDRRINSLHSNCSTIYWADNGEMVMYKSCWPVGCATSPNLRSANRSRIALYPFRRTGRMIRCRFSDNNRGYIIRHSLCMCMCVIWLCV